MNPSPFHHGAPVHPDAFVGRREVREVLYRVLSRGQSTAVVGEPRAGKTSLLHYLHHLLEHGRHDPADCSILVPVYVDAHALRGVSDASAFWEHVFAPLEGGRVPWPPGSPVRSALDACRAARFPDLSIKSLLDALKGAGVRVVLLLDEVDYLVQHPTLDPYAFFRSLRSLASNPHSALALVLACRQRLDALNERTAGPYQDSPCFNFLTERILGPLDVPEVDSILDRAGGFSPDDRRLVHDLAGGLPYLVQVSADALFRLHEAGELTPDARRVKAKAIAVRDAAGALTDTWRHWSPDQRLVVNALAAGTADPRRSSIAIDTLEDQGFLVRRGGAIHIGPQLLAEWCRSTKGERPGDDAAPASAQAQARRPLDVFISSVPADAPYRARLVVHLGSLRREGAITISPSSGSRDREDVTASLRKADLILLLTSADYVDSDFHWDVELTEAIRRGAAHVINIRVRPVDDGSHRLATLPSLPVSYPHITDAPDQEAAWHETAGDIRRRVEGRPRPA